jgi:hypothetical protein
MPVLFHPSLNTVQNKPHGHINLEAAKNKVNNIILRHTQHAKKAARSRIKKINIKLVKLMLPDCDPYNLPSQEQAQIKAHMQILRGVVEFHTRPEVKTSLNVLVIVHVTFDI